MGLFEDLKALGVDVDGGLKRLGGNEALYKRLLNTFVKSIRGQEIPLDFDTSDYEEIKEKAHAIPVIGELTTGKNIVKEIYVKGRILNIVAK